MITQCWRCVTSSGAVFLTYCTAYHQSLSYNISHSIRVEIVQTCTHYIVRLSNLAKKNHTYLQRFNITSLPEKTNNLTVCTNVPIIVLSSRYVLLLCQCASLTNFCNCLHKIESSNLSFEHSPVSISRSIFTRLLIWTTVINPWFIEIVGWVGWVDDARASREEVGVVSPLIIFLPVDAV